MKRLTTIVLSCALAACRQGEPVPAASASSDTAGPDSTVVTQPAERDTSAVAASRVLLALDGEGLRVVLQPTGSARLLSFGTGATDVIAAVTKALGAPSSRGTSADCGAGPMDFVAFADGLSIGIQKDRFVGWSARASKSGRMPTTMSGIGVGSTRAALDAAYAAKVARSTLGEEFVAGGISGVLDGAATSAQITDMWAGLNCTAR